MAQRKRRKAKAGPEPAAALEHELIVVARSGATLIEAGGRRRNADAGARALERLLERHGATLAPLFGPSVARLARAAGALGGPMTRFHRVRVPARIQSAWPSSPHGCARCPTSPAPT